MLDLVNLEDTSLLESPVLGSVESLEDKWFSASVKTPSGKKTSTVNREFANG
jgi:oligosaccharyltransferase complex subunit beta